jgi:hypothetical protein
MNAITTSLESNKVQKQEIPEYLMILSQLIDKNSDVISDLRIVRSKMETHLRLIVNCKGQLDHTHVNLL